METNTAISVGLPFIKTSMNPSQTINKKTGKKSKTGNTRLICKENLEREGKDPDIDLNKSHLNQFLTNITSTDDYMEEIERTKKQINDDLKANGKKQLRKDTVDNISLIIKPNIEAIQQLNQKEQEKFFKDSKKAIEKIWNIDIKIAVVHYDELSPHMHINFMPLLENDLGIKTFNAKQFLSLKNITKLNKNFSKEMQRCGWNVKDMNLYEEMTEEAKEEYRKNKKEHGKSSLQYKSDLKKELEKEIKNNEEIIEFQNEKIVEKNKKLEIKLEDELLNDPTKKAKILEKITDKKIEQIKNIDNTTLNLEILENNKQLQQQLQLEKDKNKKILHDNYEVGRYYDKLEEENKKLKKINTILNKIISFAFPFLPKMIKEKMEKWVEIDDILPTEEEIDNDINNLNSTTEETEGLSDQDMTTEEIAIND